MRKRPTLFFSDVCRKPAPNATVHAKTDWHSADDAGITLIIIIKMQDCHDPAH